MLRCTSGWRNAPSRCAWDRGFYRVPLLSCEEVEQVFRDVPRLFELPPSSPLAKHFLKCRRSSGRRHYELPLRHVVQSTGMSESSSSVTHPPLRVRSELPASVVSASDKLYAETFQHLLAVREEILEMSKGHTCRPFYQWNSSELEAQLAHRSVLRLLQYPLGVGCRPHVDPGLCSALLTGSATGLRLLSPPVHSASKERQDEDEKGDGASAGDFIHQTASSSEPLVLLLHNAQLEQLTDGVCRPAWHDVVPDWTKAASSVGVSANFRYNMVVELRLRARCCYQSGREI